MRKKRLGQRWWRGGEREADREGEARGTEKTWIINVLWANGKWLFHGDCLMSDSGLYQWIIYSHDVVNISLMKPRLVVGAVQPLQGTRLKVAGQSKSGGHMWCWDVKYIIFEHSNELFALEDRKKKKSPVTTIQAAKYTEFHSKISV